MKHSRNWPIGLKISAVFILFTLAILLSVGLPGALQGRAALEAATRADLTSTALEKEAALTEWFNEALRHLQVMTETPSLQEHAQMLLYDSGSAQRAYDQLAADLSPWSGPGRIFQSLYLLHPMSGEVLLSTNPDDVGKFRENQPFFIEGRLGAYVQNLYYRSNQRDMAMTVSAPLRGSDGRWLGVLAGDLNLEAMTAIVQRQPNLYVSDDAFLINRAHLPVTQPRFISDPVVLTRSLYTDAVNRCLAGVSGSALADDYRGIPAVIAYRWMANEEMCLIVKRDQAEALASSQSFTNFLALIAVIALVAGALVAYFVARGIARPVEALAAGVAEIGRGRLDIRFSEQRGDEIGRLGQAFNRMIADLGVARDETLRGQNELLALSQAAAAVQSVHAPAEVYRQVGDVLARLGYTVTAYAVTPDGAGLTLAYTSVSEEARRKAAAMLGSYRRIYPFIPPANGIWRRVLEQGETVFLQPATPFFIESLPDVPPAVTAEATEALGMTTAIATRLAAGDEALGVMVVHGAMLVEADAPAISAFANQTAIALRNAQLYAALSEASQFTGAIIDMAPVGVRTFRVTGESVSANQSAADTLDATVEALLKQNFRDLPHWKESDLLAAADLALASGEPQEADVGLTTALGRSIHLECYLAPFSAGGEQHLLLIFADVTRRKAAEDALRRARDELEQRVQERTADLARSNKELEQFAYVASHDLQEPLRMVASYLQLLQRRYRGKMGTDADEFIGFAVDGALRMKALINDLLAYSRVGTRGKALESVDCQRVLDRVLNSLQVMIQEQEAIITHDPLPTVVGDNVQLAQLFQNLIGNAIKFRGTAPPAIHIGARLIEKDDAPSYWLFSVQDNGIGIEEQYFDRIFIIFQRLHTREEYAGTGIGLAISKRIVDRHGGHIWLESSPGQGSTFYFTLPAQHGGGDANANEHDVG